MTNLIETLAKLFPNVQVHCAGDPNVYTNLVWEGGDPLPSEDVLMGALLQDIKDDAWLLIKAERDRRKAAGIKIGNYWFHTDDTSRIQQIGLVMLGANIPPGLMWKTMTGDFVEMTQALATQIFQGIAIKDTQIFGVAEQHRKNMEASADPASYDFSQGWPLVYGE